MKYSTCAKDVYKRQAYKDKDEVIRILREAVVKGTDQTIQQQHIENIKDKLGTDRIYD